MADKKPVFQLSPEFIEASRKINEEMTKAAKVCVVVGERLAQAAARDMERLGKAMEESRKRQQAERLKQCRSQQ